MIKKKIIVALNKKNAIGKENDLLFKDREDLARFKKLTTGHPIIMGRKTHESIGRALPKRTNIIVSRNIDYIPLSEPAYVTSDVPSAIKLAEAQARIIGVDSIFFIGGGEIYKQVIDLCDALYISEFDNDLDGDTFFPEYEKNQWKEVGAEGCKTHVFRLLERVSEEQNHQKENKNTKESQTELH